MIYINYSLAWWLLLCRLWWPWIWHRWPHHMRGRHPCSSHHWWRTHPGGRRHSHKTWWRSHAHGRRWIVHVRRWGDHGHHICTSLGRSRIWYLVIFQVKLGIIQIYSDFEQFFFQSLSLLSHFHSETFLDNLSRDTLHTINININLVTPCLCIRNSIHFKSQ